MTRNPHENTLILVDFIKTKKPGDIISYLDVEQSTGIKMDTYGKRYLISALNIAGMPYICSKGYGYELVSENTAVEAVGIQFCKIDNSVKRGKDVTQKISDKYLGNMSEPNRDVVLRAISFFGAIEASAQTFKLMQQSEKKKLINVTPYVEPDVSSYR